MIQTVTLRLLRGFGFEYISISVGGLDLVIHCVCSGTFLVNVIIGLNFLRTFHLIRNVLFASVRVHILFR